MEKEIEQIVIAFCVKHNLVLVDKDWLANNLEILNNISHHEQGLDGEQ